MANENESIAVLCARCDHLWVRAPLSDWHCPACGLHGLAAATTAEREAHAKRETGEVAWDRIGVDASDAVFIVQVDVDA